jgi:signal transduction histidine kinase
MVGAGVVAGPEPWLAEQARRDLAVIQGAAEPNTDEVDLIDMLRDVARLTPLQVAWHTDGELRVPGPVAAALCGAAREALTNVVRHAGVTEAEITVDSGRSLVVEVVDRGRGFAPHPRPRPAAHRYGLTASLEGRLAGVGGRAGIVSRPGHGTRVRLEVPRDAA